MLLERRELPDPRRDTASAASAIPSPNFPSELDAPSSTSRDGAGTDALAWSLLPSDRGGKLLDLFGRSSVRGDGRRQDRTNVRRAGSGAMGGHPASLASEPPVTLRRVPVRQELDLDSTLR